MPHIGLVVKVILAFVIASLIAIFVNFHGNNDGFSTLLSATSFIFGSFLAFSIASSQSRLNKIDETIKSDEGLLQYI